MTTEEPGMFDFTRQAPPLAPLTTSVADVQRHLARAIAVCNELGRLAATAALERDRAVEAAAVQADVANTRDEPWTPTGSDGARATLGEAVGQALGSASMAWRGVPAGVFDDVWCGKVYDGLMAYLSDWADEQRREASKATAVKLDRVYRLAGAQQARRGDAVAEWIRRRRDENVGPGGWKTPPWHTLDALLDDYRDHAVTGTPLTEPVQGPHPEA